MKTKIKTTKPIDSSVSLIYACPQCLQQHWVSLRAAQTKGYIIVCDCNMVFRPKRVDKIKILHINKKHKKNSSVHVNTISDHVTEQVETIPIDLLDRCVTVLVGYGFTKTEASNLVTETYKKHSIKDTVSLIKLSLSNIGVNNEQSIDQAD